MPENIICKGLPSYHINYLLDRTNIDDLLKTSLHKPLITVIAGAGYGKTHAVISAFRKIRCKSAWIQLSELDNHVPRFWERFVDSLNVQNSSLSENLMSLEYPETLSAFNHFFHLLEETFHKEERFAFVFDDLHFINNPVILNFFKLFIAAHIKNICIVLISRKKPELSLIGMLYKGMLAQITEDDLRFSKAETEAYFYRQGIDFSKNMSIDIYSYTQGWPIAIYLLSMAFKSGNMRTQDPVLAAKIDIFDMIEKEIFESVSKKLQYLLIKAALLDRLPVGLIEEMLSMHSPLIFELKQLNLLYYYDSLSKSYYFHHLFKEFLLQKKEWLSEKDISELHFMAAKWYHKNNYETEALIHYQKCGCYHEIFDIILPYNHYIIQETAEFYIKLIEQAPDEFVRTRPIIRILKATLMFNNNYINEAHQELLKIRNEYEVLPETDENLAVLGETYITLGLISIVNLDYKFENLFKMADQCLPDGSRLVDQKLNIAEGLNVCSIKNPSPGELKKHQDALFNVAPYMSRVMNGCSFGIESLNAAESSLYTGDLKLAEKNAYDAIYRSKQYQQHDIEYMAYFILVRIFMAKGKYTEISNLLKHMKNQLKTHQISKCISLYDIIRSWFYVKIEKTDKVAKWILSKEERHKILAPVILGREFLVLSDCMLAGGRYYELLAFIDQTDQIYSKRGILYALLQNKITKAIIYHYMSKYKESMTALNEAYELSYANNLVIQFIEYGKKMRTLINTARRSEHCRIPQIWLDNIYTKSSTYAKQISQIVLAYNTSHTEIDINDIKLSPRESEILTCLCRGLTRDEIATNCFLSLSTINSTIKNIYYKLDAVNIADAVRIAKEKKLL